MISITIVITKIAGDINRLSFVFTALKGVSFWDSCKLATDAMTDFHFAMIEIVIHDVFWFIRACVSCVCAAIAYTLAGSIGLFKPSIFIILTWVSIYGTITMIECILFASCEAILVCVREDAHTNGAQNSLAPPILWEVLGMFATTATQKV